MDDNRGRPEAALAAAADSAAPTAPQRGADSLAGTGRRVRGRVTPRIEPPLGPPMGRNGAAGDPDTAGFNRMLRRLGTWLGRRPNRVTFGILVGIVALGLKLLLNAISGEDTGYSAYYLLLAASAATGGMASGVATTVTVALGQAVFYPPPGSFPIADPASALRLGLFTISGLLVSVITNGLLRARLGAESVGGELTRLYDAQTAARQAAEDAGRRTQILFETAASLSDALTPVDVAAVVIRQGVLALGAVGGTVHTLSADGTAMVLLRADGYPREVIDSQRRVPIDGDAAIAEVARSGQPVYLKDRAEIERRFSGSVTRPHLDGEEAFLGLPVTMDNRTIAVISLGFAGPQSVSQDDRDFHANLAQQTGQALERARLYEAERAAREAEQLARTEAEESRAALAFLAEASRLLAASLDYEATIQHVADLSVPLLADWCAVDLVEPDGSIRALAVAHADPDQRALLREYRDRFPPREVAVGSALVIASGEPLLIPVITDDDLDRTAPNPEIAVYAKRLRIHSYLAVPLRTPEGILGAIAFASSVPGRFTSAERGIAEDLARRASDAIRHARLYREARQLVATVDAALDAVFMFDPTNLRFTYVNQGAVNQVGWSREDLLSMSALEIKPDFDEAGYRELLAPLLDGSRPSITFSTSHLHRDGTRVPVEAFLQAVRPSGDNVRMIVTARDIRQQIEVEANLYRLARAERARAAELSAVIRGMGEGVLVCDPEGRVILSNPAAAAILTTSVERYEDLIALLDPPAEDLPQLASAGGPVEVQLAGADRWLDLSTYPVSLESSELYGEAETTIIVLRDVTAARRARAAREAFIGVMSHELRTPITTIYGTTKLFARASESPELMKSMLADVESEADRLYRLVEDLLILSRSETEIQIEGEPVLLQHVVRSVLAGESTRWPETRFMANVPTGLPPVSGDRTYLEQVVRNLLSNAAKYSPPGTPVEVRAEVDGQQIAVRVLDTGPGFANDEAESLFELFYRSPATSRKVTGAGIGLYVSRALIEAMGGRIWARPRPAGGAEFGFTVPILELEAEPDDLDEASPAAE